MGQNKIKEKDNFGNLLFLIAYVPVLFISSLSTTLYVHVLPSYYINTIILFGMAVLCFKLLITDSYTFIQYMFYTIIAVVLMIATIKSGDKQVIILTAFLLMGKGTDDRSVIRAYFFVSIIVLLFSYFSTKLGWIMDLTYTRNMIVRHSYGIVYPTDFAAHIFYVCCAYAFLRYKKYDFKDVSLLTLIALLVYRQTNSRLDSGLIFILGIAIWIGKNNKFRRLINVSWLMAPLGFIFTYLSTKNFNSGSDFFAVLDKFFSGRLEIVQELMNEYGIKMWGQKIIEHGWGGMGFFINRNIYKYTYIDSTYMRLLLIYGIAACATFILMITFFTKKAKDTELLIIVALILFSGIVEQHFIDIAYNPFFILLVSNYYKEKGLR